MEQNKLPTHSFIVLYGYWTTYQNVRDKKNVAIRISKQEITSYTLFCTLVYSNDISEISFLKSWNFQGLIKFLNNCYAPHGIMIFLYSILTDVAPQVPSVECKQALRLYLHCSALAMLHNSDSTNVFPPFDYFALNQDLCDHF